MFIDGSLSQGVLHPVVTTALAGNAGAALYGSLVGVDYAHALKIYYSKVWGWLADGVGCAWAGLVAATVVPRGFVLG